MASKSINAKVLRLDIGATNIPISNATISGTIGRPDATDSSSNGWMQTVEGHRQMKIDFEGDIKSDDVSRMPDYFLDGSGVDLTVKAYISATGYWTGPMLLEGVTFNAPVRAGDIASFRGTLTSNGAMTFVP